MASGKRETLGTNVVPSNYKLHLDTNMKTFKYEGRETIAVNVKHPTNIITLNSKFIKIKSASIVAKGASYPAKVSYDSKLERATLRTAKKVSGQAKLEIEFRGETQYNMRGFYRSKYNYKGKEGWILTSQFEAVNARNAFPCFDEPSLKATFDLTLTIDSDLTAVSNMPIKSETASGKGRKSVTFRTTPIMSTYLLYIGIGPFEYVKWRAKGLDFRIITTPGKSSHVGLAREYAPKFIDFQQLYFRVRYPLSKMDFIAIPDFQAGAMENWGAITSREIGLLGDKENTSVPIKRYIAIIVSHELAHQWFGDLVTMKWWNDLWLNESFATFMEEKTVEAMYPKWKMRVSHIVNDTAGLAMADDQLRTTHPIHVEVNSPSEIEQILDHISYEKGSAVLRMLEDYVTPEVFRKGLKLYFTKHAYSNTAKEDLWNAIAKTGDKIARDLPKVATFWIENEGFPIIYADGPKDGTFRLRQERFTILPYHGPRKNWPIPVRYLTDKGEGFLMLSQKEQSLKVPGATFIKLNLGQSGFYRTAYSDKNLKRLGAAIKSGKLDALDSWGIINDMMALARSCRMKISDVLDFIEDYCMEREYPVNSAIASYFSGLSLRFYNKGAVYKRANGLEVQFARKNLKRLGWKKMKDEPQYVTTLRSGAIATLGRNKEKAVVAKARTMFFDYIKKGKPIDSDLKTAVYCIVAANGGAKEFKMFAGMYAKTDNPEEQRALFGALGSFMTLELNSKALQFSLGKHVRPQDKGILKSYISSNPVGKELSLKWTERNWQHLRKLYAGNTSLIVDPIEDLSMLQTAEDLKEVRRFFYLKSNYVSDINRTLKNTLEYIESNARFVEYNS
jgi:tricorn protease interacting factor F2/3